MHCAVSGYSTLAAYRAQLMEEGYDVITVDAGDAIQGEAIGSMTEGSAIVDLMNTVGYDFAVPGNHEFDYGMDRFLELAENEAEYTYLSSNFKDLRTGETVFEPYEIVEMNGEDVAFEEFPHRKLIRNPHPLISRMKTEITFTASAKMNCMIQFRTRQTAPEQQARTK